MARQTLNTAQDRSTALPTMHLGRVKRSYSPTPGHARKPASNDTNFLRTSRQDGELDAWARRAMAASGFGDAPAGAAVPTVMPDAAEVTAAARTARSASLWEVIAVVTDAVRASVRRGISAWRRQRDERRHVSRIARPRPTHAPRHRARLERSAFGGCGAGRRRGSHACPSADDAALSEHLIPARHHYLPPTRRASPWKL